MNKLIVVLKDIGTGCGIIACVMIFLVAFGIEGIAIRLGRFFRKIRKAL